MVETVQTNDNPKSSQTDSPVPKNSHVEASRKSVEHSGKKLALEDVYKQLGGMGIYQCVTAVLLCFISFKNAESISINFVGGDQDHWCYVEELMNLSHSHQKYIAIPINDDGEYEQCEYYDLDYSSYSLDDFIDWNRSMFTNASTRSCSHWVYDKSVYINTMTSRFDLVCGDSWMVSLVSTFSMGGLLVGSPIAGVISDKMGRKTALWIGCILKFVSSLVASFEIHFSVTCVARFILGLSNFICFLPSLVLAIELAPAVWRTILGIAFNICYSIGFMLWPGLAYAVRDDVKLQLVAAIPFVWLLGYWWLLDESPMWLLQKKLFNEADRVLRRMASINRTSLPEDFDVRSIKEMDEEDETGETKGCTSLLTSPTMRLRTIIIDLFMFSVSLMYHALSLNTGKLSGDIFINTLISGLVEIPATILCAVLLSWRVTGRRLTCLISLFIAGISSFISIYMILEDIGVAHTIFATVSKGFVTMSFSAAYIYSPELYPTEVRSTGLGIAAMCAGISGMAAPYIGGPLRDVWEPLPVVVYGSFAVISSLLMAFLPETRDAPLFKTIEEAETFAKKPKTRQYEEGSDDDGDAVNAAKISSFNALNAAFESEETRI